MYQELLKQAEHLAKLDKKRPGQANLRRAVSGAYYAMFHFTAAQIADQMVGITADTKLRNMVVRSLTHTEMSKAAKAFDGGTLPLVVKDCLGTASVPIPLARFARTFHELQEERHRADYDRSAIFRRPVVITLIAKATTAIEEWGKIKNDRATQCFLVFALMGKQLQQR